MAIDYKEEKMKPEIKKRLRKNYVESSDIPKHRPKGIRVSCMKCNAEFTPTIGDHIIRSPPLIIGFRCPDCIPTPLSGKCIDCGKDILLSDNVEVVSTEPSREIIGFRCFKCAENPPDCSTRDFDRPITKQEIQSWNEWKCEPIGHSFTPKGDKSRDIEKKMDNEFKNQRKTTFLADPTIKVEAVKYAKSK